MNNMEQYYFPMENRRLGDIIRVLLKENGMTQQNLAERICVTESAVSQYLANKRLPEYPILIEISRTLGASCDYLLGNESHGFSMENKASAIELNIMERFRKTNALGQNLMDSYSIYILRNYPLN